MMFRDRTNLYISYRKSYPHHAATTTGYSEIPEEQQELIGGEQVEAIGIEMDILPPSWVDISYEVDELLAEIRQKMTQLESLHRKNALPGFNDRSHEEEQIERLTYDITSHLHSCQGLVKRFDNMTKNETSPAEIKMSANMKVSLATKIQEVSSSFRKMQSNYLRSLKKESSFPVDRASSPLMAGNYDPVADDDMDVAMSRNTLQQSSMLAASEDMDIRQREQEITKIAQGILELADIFKDLQTMVIDQGTLLDRIDYNVETMYTNVKSADKELIKATHYQKRTQKCKIILFLTLVVIGLAIVLILKPKHHDSAPQNPAPPVSPPVDDVPERPVPPSLDQGSPDTSDPLPSLDDFDGANF